MSCEPGNPNTRASAFRYKRAIAQRKECRFGTQSGKSTGKLALVPAPGIGGYGAGGLAHAPPPEPGVTERKERSRSPRSKQPPRKVRPLFIAVTITLAGLNSMGSILKKSNS